MMKVTALCITKNSEKTIERSIRSYVNAVDEVIIIDTGSTDNTKEICEGLGCTIYDFEWGNDFAEVRNYALSKANGDFILFLDSDEYFKEDLLRYDKDKLIDIINGYDSIKFHTDNIDVAFDKCIGVEYNIKFFKNKESVQYRRKVHEVLEIDGLSPKSIFINNYEIIHTGYGEFASKDKCTRNLEILNSLDTYETIDFYYLTRENLSILDYREANKYCNLFFEQSDYKEIIDTSTVAYLIYFYKYRIMKYYLKLDNSTLLTYLQSCKDVLYNIPEYYYYLAEFYYDYNYKLAIENYMTAIKVNNDNSTIGKINSFNHIQGTIYYRLSRLERTMGDYLPALNHATVACMLEHGNMTFYLNFLQLIKRKSVKKAIEMIYLTYKPKTTSDFAFIVNGLVQMKLDAVFMHFIMEYNKFHNGGSHLVYLGMILNRQHEYAIETALGIYEKLESSSSKPVHVNLYMAALAVLDSNDINIYHKYIDRILGDYGDILRLYYENKTPDSGIDYHIYYSLYKSLYTLGSDAIYKLDLSNASFDMILEQCRFMENSSDYSGCLHMLETALNSGQHEEYKKDIIDYIYKILCMTKNKNKMLYYISQYQDDIYIELLYKYINLLFGENISTKNDLIAFGEDYA